MLRAVSVLQDSDDVSYRTMVEEESVGFSLQKITHLSHIIIVPHGDNITWQLDLWV